MVFSPWRDNGDVRAHKATPRNKRTKGRCQLDELDELKQRQPAHVQHGTEHLDFESDFKGEHRQDAARAFEEERTRMRVAERKRQEKPHRVRAHCFPNKQIGVVLHARAVNSWPLGIALGSLQASLKGERAHPRSCWRALQGQDSSIARPNKQPRLRRTRAGCPFARRTRAPSTRGRRSLAASLPLPPSCTQTRQSI